eukprot:XP_025008250.1 tumor necrosis factor receptor superfamily member 19L isoform X1 [Gallus gallus]
MLGHGTTHALKSLKTHQPPGGIWPCWDKGQPMGWDPSSPTNHQVAMLEHGTTHELGSLKACQPPGGIWPCWNMEQPMRWGPSRPTNHLGADGHGGTWDHSWVRVLPAPPTRWRQMAMLEHGTTHVLKSLRTHQSSGGRWPCWDMGQLMRWGPSSPTNHLGTGRAMLGHGTIHALKSLRTHQPPGGIWSCWDMAQPMGWGPSSPTNHQVAMLEHELGSLKACQPPGGIWPCWNMEQPMRWGPSRPTNHLGADGHVGTWDHSWVRVLPAPPTSWRQMAVLEHGTTHVLKSLRTHQPPGGIWSCWDMAQPMGWGPSSPTNPLGAGLEVGPHRFTAPRIKNQPTNPLPFFFFFFLETF